MNPASQSANEKTVKGLVHPDRRGTCPAEVEVVGQTPGAPAIILTAQAASGSTIASLAVTGFRCRLLDGRENFVYGLIHPLIGDLARAHMPVTAAAVFEHQ